MSDEAQKMNRPHPLFTPHVAQNYMPVPEAGCWLWLGYVNDRGYGQVGGGDNGCMKAHRLFFAVHVRPLMSGEIVCHKCDTPSCVNPDHLFVGTNADNSADMVMKGRQSKGSHRRQSKLTEEIVAQVRNRYRQGEHPRDISKAYGVSRTLIYDVISNRRWRHVA